MEYYFIVLHIGFWKIINFISKYVCKRQSLVSLLRSSFPISTRVPLKQMDCIEHLKLRCSFTGLKTHMKHY